MLCREGVVLNNVGLACICTDLVLKQALLHLRVMQQRHQRRSCFTAGSCARRLAKLLAKEGSDEGSEQARELFRECLDITEALLQRYQRSGDLVSALILAENALAVTSGWLSDDGARVNRLVKLQRNFEQALDPDDTDKVCLPRCCGLGRICQFMYCHPALQHQPCLDIVKLNSTALHRCASALT